MPAGGRTLAGERVHNRYRLLLREGLQDLGGPGQMDATADNDRLAKALLKALSEKPSLFIEMLSAAFKPSEGSGVVDPTPPHPDCARNIAQQAYRLLDLWDRLPGSREDGTIDGQALEAWIKEAHSLAKSVGREDIADRRIGAMPSASPIGKDGVWPDEAVRDVIDLFRSKSMIQGFQIGKMNRRGITSRMPRDGGNLEREEAAKYRNWAAAIIYDHPHTAKALDTLAERYEDEARHHDEDAERLDGELSPRRSGSQERDNWSQLGLMHGPHLFSLSPASALLPGTKNGLAGDS